jgi:hypothetical protein
MFKAGVVVQQHALQVKTVPTFKEPEAGTDDFNHQTPIVALPHGGEAQNTATANGKSGCCVCLDLEDLKCFEVVEQQYQRWGVIFSNCIAIQPSNPAFPPHSGTTVLMGAPKSGFLEATFVHPVQLVSTYVTSSQRLVFTAYDSDRKMLRQETLAGSNLANSDSPLQPNAPLKLTAKNIHRVTFCAFDGQFTIDDFSFCY